MELGYINACIAGDHRYSSRVSVTLEDDGSVTVERHENGAIGGMDGPGGSYGFSPVHSEQIPAEKVTPTSVVKATRAAFDDVIKTYGKPSKNFEWYVDGGVVNGLSAAKVKKALSGCK